MSQQEEPRIDIPSSLPVIPLRDVVIFPYMIFPLFVGREGTVRAVDEALNRNRMIFLLTQKDASIQEPKEEDLYQIGTAASIMRMFKLPDGKIKVLVQGLVRARVKRYSQFAPFIEVDVDKLESLVPPKALEVTALMKSVQEQAERAVSLGKPIPSEIMLFVNNIEDPGRLADLVVANLEVKVEESQSVLEILDPVDRLRKVSEYLNREIQILSIQRDIMNQAKGEIDKSQREYYLRQQMKTIQDELGEGDDYRRELDELKEAIEAAKMPPDVHTTAMKQLSRLEKMHPESAESGVARTYIDWLIELPWSKATKDRLNLERAQRILDEDHYGLEKIKERILEFLAVRKLKKKHKGPILCFVGPPGVGKTSLGKSIARALGRKFVRISLGGVRDEAEIRGHRRTYVGALPGRIIQSIRQAGSKNPVIMMDEVDKIGQDFRGDPSAALLEVLDPEQNHEFRDHYLEVPFDLRSTLFITTANILDTIHPAFLDRMEVIELSGYTEEEKLKIARKYLIPKQMKENGVSEKYILFDDDALRSMITDYTHEAGLRNLERTIGTTCRKVARRVAEGRKEQVQINAESLLRFLGAPHHIDEVERGEDTIGVVTGLAVTSAGGDTLTVEATLMQGKGQLILTGHLGDVMKESATAAMSYIRHQAAEYGISEKIFAEKDFHVHVPAGATPKDGPSAGITICTALVSAMTERAVSRSVTMTGEITLTGRVLRIGGVKEKFLAARRAKTEIVFFPAKNKVDYDELPPEVKEGTQVFFVEHVREVLDRVFPGLRLPSGKPAMTGGKSSSRTTRHEHPA